MTGKQPCTHEDLKAIADAQHRPSLVDEAAQLCIEMDRQIFCQQRPCSQIVAIGKTAGYHQEMIIQQGLRVLDELIDMDKVRIETNEATGLGRFTITVDAWST